MDVRISLLGRPKVYHLGGLTDLPLDRRTELLAYIALADGWVERARLALLLWPEAEREQARQNLRQLLVRVRRFPFTEDVEAKPERVRWTVGSDVAEFRTHLRRQAWEEAVGAYGGTLLSGLEALHSPEFAAWLELERQTLHGGWRTASLKLVAQKQEAGAFAAAKALLAPLLQAEELDEESLQIFLSCAAKAGERHEALNRYERFRHRLKAELGLEPLPATQAIARAVQAGELGRAPEPVPPQRGLPAPLTPFIGRDLEREEIGRMLAEPSCRLLTLLGPGGMGKTRLAVQLAGELSTQYKDGVGFVPLVSLQDSALIPAAILAALDLPLVGQIGSEEQLLGFLRKRQFLLVLDNFEHLLPDADLLERLLEAAPNLKILTTSRERLGLAGEWVLEVGGMLLPQSEAHAESFEAVQLFVRNAQRVEHSFALTPHNHAAVVRICRLLGGSPLGLILASAWVRLLPCEEIASELGKSLDFVGEALPELPERHRSLRRVFEHSFGRLGAEEQAALARLSVFQGGFAREAAEAVAGVSLRTLLSLLDKSLLQRTGERLTLHEQVRQYAAEQLGHRPEALAQTVSAHGRHYTDFFAQSWDTLRLGPTQLEALRRVGEELDNIRLAWDWACANRDAEVLGRAAGGIWYFELTSAWQQGWDMNARALDSIPPKRPERARLLGFHAALAFRLGRTPQALQLAEESLRLSQQFGLPYDPLALVTLGNCRLTTGDLGGAKTAYEWMLQEATRQGDSQSMGGALAQLAMICAHTQDFAAAEYLNRRSHELSRSTGDRWGLAFSRYHWGAFLVMQRRWREAADAFGEALSASRELRMLFIVADCHKTLGQCLQALGEPKQAREHFVHSYTALSAIADQSGYEDSYLLGLKATVSRHLGLAEESLGHYAHGLRLCLSRQEAFRAHSMALGVAQALRDTGRQGAALEVLGFLGQAPWSLSPGDREEMEKLKADLGGETEFHAAFERGARMDSGEFTALLEQFTPSAVS